MTHRAWAFVLLSGCAWPLKGYEVPILPEEVALMTADRITGGLLRRDPDQIVAAYSEDFRSLYDAGTWVKSSESPGLETRRWTPSGKTRELEKSGIRAEWERYLSSFRAIARVEQKPRFMQARQSEPECVLYLVVEGVDLEGRFRSDRLWIRYTFSSDTGPWLVTSQEILRGDAAVGTRSRFRDVARDNGTAYPHNPTAEFGPRQMAGNSFPLVVRGDSGVAVADFDNDGWPDIYYCDGVRNCLLRNRGDGTFEDVTEKAGLGGPQAVSRSAVFADFDNDGWLDLFVTYEGAPCRLYKNMGNGTFRDITQEAGVGYVGFPTSVAVADYDNDGLLDIYIGCYGDHTNRYPELQSKNGDPNVLFRNLGGMRFKDVARESGVDDRGWTLGVTWADYNGDGWPDLFVCNDFGKNALYRNDGNGRFTEVTEEAGLSADGFWMSCAFGDSQNTGTLDLYLAGMYSNAGQWIFKHDDLLPGPYLKAVRARVLGLLDTMTSGNRLFRNDGRGRFTEVARKAGVDYGQFAWCSPWVDFDNDGFLDLYCCNGYWTGPSPDDT